MPAVCLDVSCLNRPFDDQTQPRIRLEAEAVAVVLALAAAGDVTHVSSQMATIEIAAMPDDARRSRVQLLLPDAADVVALSPRMFARAKELETLGVKPADAVHTAAAEAIGADVLLTCDDRFLRIAQRHRARLKVRVENPVTWIQETTT